MCINKNAVACSHWATTILFLPPAHEVAGRYCFHRCLSVTLSPRWGEWRVGWWILTPWGGYSLPQSGYAPPPPPAHIHGPGILRDIDDKQILCILPECFRVFCHYEWIPWRYFVTRNGCSTHPFLTTKMDCIVTMVTTKII